MEKSFYYGISALITGAGCKGGDGDDLRLEKSSLQLHVGEDASIGSNLRAEWSSGNDFIAAVDSEGSVTGKHVGTTVITATAGVGRQECKVEIVPRYDTYIEPVYDLFRKPAYMLEERETRELVSREENKITYKGEKPYIKEVSYGLWDFGKADHDWRLSSAHIVIAGKEKYRQEIYDFLLERHELEAEDEEAAVFLGYDENNKIVSAITAFFNRTDDTLLIAYRGVANIN